MQHRCDEVLAAMAAGARPVAGGSDLVVGARQGKAPLPDAVVAIDRVDVARAASTESADGVRIGALVNHATLEVRPGDRRRGTAASPTPARWSARRRRATSARSAAT